MFNKKEWQEFDRPTGTQMNELEQRIADMGASGGSNAGNGNNGSNTSPNPSPPFEPPSIWFTDPETGVIWRILLPNDGNGNALIITERVFGATTAYSLGNVYRTFEGSNLQNVQNQWFTDPSNVGETIKKYAMSYEFQDHNGNPIPRQNLPQASVGMPIRAGIEIDFNGSNFPDMDTVLLPAIRANTKAIRGNPEPFTLSFPECAYYFGDNANRVAFDENSMPTPYWTRSVGGTAANPVRRVSAIGATNSVISTALSGFRPALWVDSALLREVDFMIEPPTTLPVGPNVVWRDPETDFQWLVIAHQGDYSLLLSRFVIHGDSIDNNNPNYRWFNNMQGQWHPHQDFHNPHIFVPWSANHRTDGVGVMPQIRNRFTTWWRTGNQVSQRLRDIAVHANIPTRFTTATPNADRGGDTNITSLSTPLDIPASTTTVSPVFLLNEAEINAYLGANSLSTNAERTVSAIRADGSILLTMSGQFLRSAGSAPNNPNNFVVAGTLSTGAWTSHRAEVLGMNDGYRPAIWVKRGTLFNTGMLSPFQVLQDDMQKLSHSFFEQLEEKDKKIEELNAFIKDLDVSFPKLWRRSSL